MTAKKKTKRKDRKRVNVWIAGVVVICLLGFGLILNSGTTTTTTTSTTVGPSYGTTTTILNTVESTVTTTLLSTTATTYPPQPMDDKFLLGYTYQNECIAHNVIGCPTNHLIRVCTDDALVCYDAPRMNYGYISNTFISFKLKVEEKQGMLKIFSMNFNSLGCRELDVYVDGTMLGRIYQTGTVPGTEHGWYTFEYVMPSSEILTVTLRHSMDDNSCVWGHDIGRVEFISYESYANIVDETSWMPVVHPDRGWIIRA